MRLETFAMFTVWAIGAFTVTYFAAHVLAYAINGTQGALAL